MNKSVWFSSSFLRAIAAMSSRLKSGWTDPTALPLAGCGHTRPDSITHWSEGVSLAALSPGRWTNTCQGHRTSSSLPPPAGVRGEGCTSPHEWPSTRPYPCSTSSCGTGRDRTSQPTSRPLRRVFLRESRAKPRSLGGLSQPRAEHLRTSIAPQPTQRSESVAAEHYAVTAPTLVRHRRLSGEAQKPWQSVVVRARSP